MASFLPLCFSLLFLFSTLSHASFSTLLLPVTKDDSTLQYFTTISYGAPVSPTNLVLHLGGSLLWVDCASTDTPSSSLRSIPHRSIQCLTAKSHKLDTHTYLSNHADQGQKCQILAENGVSGKRDTEGELVEDVFKLRSSEDYSTTTHQQELLFACSNTLLLNGLATGARGMLGLGRSRSSFSSQVFHSLGLERKINLCLSSSSGFVQFGNFAYESQPEILRSMTFTPLVTQTHPSHEYFIKVNSIKVNGRKVSFFNPESLSQDKHEIGLTLLSSVVPYTTIQSSIYKNFESAYLRAASSMNLTSVAPVAPFGLCFSSNGVEDSQVGLKVPVVDLVMQSEMVKWSIFGRNSMVRVSNEVMCLGFLDGGLNPRNPIVIGGYQLEDVLLQFDFDTSMVGFSSSLLKRQTSCSDFRFGSLPTQSI